MKCIIQFKDNPGANHLYPSIQNAIRDLYEKHPSGLAIDSAGDEVDETDPESGHVAKDGVLIHFFENAEDRIFDGGGDMINLDKAIAIVKPTSL